MRVVKPQTPGEYMRCCRIAAGLSVCELALRADVQPNVIYDAESGRSTPRLSSLILLVDALGLTLDEYVGHRVKEAEA